MLRCPVISNTEIKINIIKIMMFTTLNREVDGKICKKVNTL